MHQLSLVSIISLLISSTQSLFIPTDLNEFETITTQTNLKQLQNQYPQGKILDDINDPNEKIFVYNIETLGSYTHGKKSKESVDEIVKKETILSDDGLI
ncbi:hypothetical protein KGF54_003551 [Candida jiufengensis]|uniref:uncharacterized protein n=1 Tax=Candida jiufengensis TaxID=497108 RepID=UPI002224AA12|nr:uncharacterized protein KGF54_003551 [Candida jiufengensis]KAI5952684.1 hypothetical protein KGF54_003551 [Candida jiufengensis]